MSARILQRSFGIAVCLCVSVATAGVRRCSRAPFDTQIGHRKRGCRRSFPAVPSATLNRQTQTAFANQPSPTPRMSSCPASPTLASLPLAFPGLSLHSPPALNSADPLSPPEHSLLHTSSTSFPSPEDDSSPAIFRLPQELLELVGLELCRLDPVGPPAGLVNLLLTCRRFNQFIGIKNDGFYADLFRERFDFESVSRRWQTQVGSLISIPRAC